MCKYDEQNINTFCVCFRYYDQIVALESKIPPSEIQIPFKWKDAFDRGSIFGGRISLSKYMNVIIFDHLSYSSLK